MLDRQQTCYSNEGCETTEGAFGEAQRGADVAEWFEREILPHRVSLERYLARCFPHEADLEDIAQQSLERVLARSSGEPIENPKFYLRRTAWSLLQSRFRRRAVTSIEYYADLSVFDFQCDAPLPDDICAAREEFALLQALYSELSPQSQAAIQQIRLDGRPFLEVAAALDLTVSGVAKRVRTAVRKLRAEMEARGVFLGHESQASGIADARVGG